MTLLALRVYGLPVPQGRPRARAFRLPTGHITASVYERAQDKDWKRTVQGQVIAHKPPAPVEGPLAMSLAFLLPRPKSLPKRERHHTKKPDVTNLVKAIEDALNGIIYRDDSQIVDLRVTKGYDQAPGVVIQIEHVVDQPALITRTV